MHAAQTTRQESRAPAAIASETIGSRVRHAVAMIFLWPLYLFLASANGSDERHSLS